MAHQYIWMNCCFVVIHGYSLNRRAAGSWLLVPQGSLLSPMTILGIKLIGNCCYGVLPYAYIYFYNTMAALELLLWYCAIWKYLLYQGSSNLWWPRDAIWQHRTGSIFVQNMNHWLHYNDVIMGMIASQMTSLTIVYSTLYWDADQRKH